MATAPKINQPGQLPNELEAPSSLRRVVRTQLLRRREQLQKARPDLHTTQLVQLMKEVDAALERIEEGTFGVCEHCHAAVEDQELITNPLVRFCLDCLPPEQQRLLERDLELAAQIQTRLLPKRDMRVDGWNVAYHYRPFGIVSGDYCDLIPRSRRDSLFPAGRCFRQGSGVVDADGEPERNVPHTGSAGNAFAADGGTREPRLFREHATDAIRHPDFRKSNAGRRP